MDATDAIGRTGRVVRIGAGSSGGPGRARVIDLGPRRKQVLERAGSWVVRRRGEDAPRLPDLMVIGSHPSCDLVLQGLRPRHAVLGRDAQGRSVLKALAGGCYVDGAPIVSQLVDADSDVRIGAHRIALGTA